MWGTQHDTRWFEADASRKGGYYFDKTAGSGLKGFNSESENYFNFERYQNGRGTPYTNPRRGHLNPIRYYTRGVFHWSDLFL